MKWTPLEPATFERRHGATITKLNDKSLLFTGDNLYRDEYQLGFDIDLKNITAIRLEPEYAPAQREMGIFQLAVHNPSLARNFLIRAAQINPADSAAQGYLGCALMGLNRAAEAQKFFARAGSGTWSSCVTIQPTAAAQTGP